MKVFYKWESDYFKTRRFWLTLIIAMVVVLLFLVIVPISGIPQSWYVDAAFVVSISSILIVVVPFFYAVMKIPQPSEEI